jgi:trehalose synthase
VPRDRLNVIAPSIDPLSPKNRPLADVVALDAMRHSGIVDGGTGRPVHFDRSDGSPGRFLHFADIIRTGPPPGADVPLVAQVSRWDDLKDMAGVMHGFVEHVMDETDAHLVLAGPVVTSIADDPTAAAVLADVWTQWRALPHVARSRVQLVCLPMADGEENAALVNALQRHAAVVVQKSLREGFGLTVTEAMYKGTACVASRSGGLEDQIEDGVNGLLVDPTDLPAFGAAVTSLLQDPRRRAEIGTRAHDSVVERYLPDSSLEQWAEVVLAAHGDRLSARRGEARKTGGRVSRDHC